MVWGILNRPKTNGEGLDRPDKQTAVADGDDHSSNQSDGMVCSVCYKDMRTLRQSRWLCHSDKICNQCSKKYMRTQIKNSYTMACPLCRGSYFANYSPNFLELIFDKFIPSREKNISAQREEYFKSRVLGQMH